MGHLMGAISYEKVYFLVELPVGDLTTKIEDFVSFEKYDFSKPLQSIKSQSYSSKWAPSVLTISQI